MQDCKNNFTGEKFLKYVGYAVSLIALIYTVIEYIDISSDASMRAFAPLVLIEGGFFILVGLVIAWIGHRLYMKRQKTRIAIKCFYK